MPVLLSFSSVLLAFFLFLHDDHRLFLLRLPAINCNQALCRRGEIERPPLFHPSPIFHPFFHSLVAERRAAAVIFFSDALWMRSAMQWSRERLRLPCRSPVECGMRKNSGWTWRCPEEREGNRGLRSCVCLCLKNASACTLSPWVPRASTRAWKVVWEQTGCWCFSFRQRCMDAH